MEAAEHDQRAVRKIIHIDMDAFYASIEQRDHPEWRGKPLIVGGDPNRRGVVATCSYEARRFGVHSAMAARTAYRLCPQATFVFPRFDVYRAVSAQIMQIFHEYTDLVEPLSLDEAYLDVTQNTKGEPSATLIAREIKRAIFAHTGLTASAGVSFNKFISKLASDYQKPDGLTVIPPQRAMKFLEQTAIDKFFGVGKVTASRLRALDIATGADLKRLREDELRSLFHERGSLLYAFVRGQDERPVRPTRERKSVGKEITLVEDSDDPAYLLQCLEHMAEQVEQRLKTLELRAKTVTLKIKWHDFQQMTRSVTVPGPVQDATAMVSTLAPVLIANLNGLYKHKRVRLVGVTVSNFVLADEKDWPEMISMPSLWDEWNMPPP